MSVTLFTLCKINSIHRTVNKIYLHLLSTAVQAVWHAQMTCWAPRGTSEGDEHLTASSTCHTNPRHEPHSSNFHSQSTIASLLLYEPLKPLVPSSRLSFSRQARVNPSPAPDSSLPFTPFSPPPLFCVPSPPASRSSSLSLLSPLATAASCSSSSPSSNALRLARC